MPLSCGWGLPRDFTDDDMGSPCGACTALPAFRQAKAASTQMTRCLMLRVMQGRSRETGAGPDRAAERSDSHTGDSAYSPLHLSVRLNVPALESPVKLFLRVLSAA